MIVSPSPSEQDFRLNSSIYSFPQAGAFVCDGSVSFCVWAPELSKLTLKVNGSSYPMEKGEQGYWSKSIDGLTAGARYGYESEESGKILPDPASMSQPDGVHGLSEIIAREFAWSDNEWTGLPLNEMILYEIHVGTFTNEGTFEAIIDKLGYLRELGVNAIELMPVAQFPGTRNWGYDGVFPFAVQNSYGGAAGLKKLVDACHQAGIAVILDVVYNHLGPEGNYLDQYGPYFTDKYKTGWGKAINFDDAWCDGVRNYYWQNALMWLDEFHIDGLRLDAVHAIWDFSANHFLEELAKKVKKLTEVTGMNKILIAEFDLNNPRYINPTSEGGYGLNAQWCDEFHHALHSLLTKETDGYYEDFGSILHLERAIKDSYVYTGQYSKHRKKFFGRRPANPYHQFVVFAQNHDQVGNRLLGDRLSSTLDLEQLKLAAAAYLLSPHVPLIFMGEEYGEKNPFQYFISHGDQQLIENVRSGRKKEFEYFNWKEDVPDPQAEETFRKCILTHEHNDTQSSTLLRFYQALIRIRTHAPAMRETDRSSVRVYPSSDNTLFYTRTDGIETFAIALNFDEKTQDYEIPVSSTKAHKILDSSDTMWNGPGSYIDSVVNNGVIRINPHSAVLLKF